VSSDFERLYGELSLFVLKQRNRQRVADLAGLHLNTVSEIINGKRNPNLQTLIALERACNQIKSNLTLSN
jgi:transcriptional regulator with XRE-family HTH domain